MAKQMDQFKAKMLDPQAKRVADAKAIMDNPNHPWKDEAQKNAGKAQYESYKAWLTFYQQHYDAGMELVKQHEQITNLLAKWYAVWREDISNEGRQETELMSMQADMLQSVFEEMYRELLPLKLDIKAPKPLNLK
jgi:hypothetical protein